MRCHTNSSLKHLTYPTENSLRRAPIAATILFQILILILDLNTAFGGDACPGLLMALAFPCTIWSAYLLIELYRFQYNARATGLSTTLRIPQQELIVDLNEFATVNDGDIEVTRTNPEYVWQLFREETSEMDSSGDKVYQCYGLLSVWHFLVFMIAGSQTYLVRQKVGECTINDVEVKLFFQASFMMLVLGICSVCKTQQIHEDDPEFLSYRRVSKSVCYLGGFGVIVISIPGSLVAGSFIWVLFMFTIAWNIIALTSLSPFIPELERWASGWAEWIKMQRGLPNSDTPSGLSRLSMRRKRKSNPNNTSSIFIAFEQNIDDRVS